MGKSEWALVIDGHHIAHTYNVNHSHKHKHPHTPTNTKLLHQSSYTFQHIEYEHRPCIPSQDAIAGMHL